MTSDRVFSTLFYPNALAGALLLFLPAMLVCVWRAKRWLTMGARLFLVIALGGVALACLFWSGSKGGWLLMLLLGLVAVLRLRFSRQWKILLVSGILVVGLAGFFVRYARFFQRGATSVGARFDYWRAAAETAKSNAFYGTGPGTFSRAYQKIKRPEAEMSRLVHNDYLQQASDSGIPGALAYSSFVLVALIRGYQKCGPAGNWLSFSIWLGLLGWSLQGMIEFGLYIPALAWPAFGFAGWLLGSPPNGIDKGTAQTQASAPDEDSVPKRAEPEPPWPAGAGSLW
jgi:O-antigen ligase